LWEEEAGAVAALCGHRVLHADVYGKVISLLAVAAAAAVKKGLTAVAVRPASPPATSAMCL